MHRFTRPSKVRCRLVAAQPSSKRLRMGCLKTTESNGSPVKWDRVLYGPKVDRHSLLERWKMKSDAGSNQAGNQLISAFQEGQVGKARFMLS